MAYGPSDGRDGNDDAINMASPSTSMAEKRRRAADTDEYDEDEPLAARLKRARISGQIEVAFDNFRTTIAILKSFFFNAQKDESGHSWVSNTADKGRGKDGVQTQVGALQRRSLELESQLKSRSAHARATEDELETLKLTFTSDLSAIEEGVSCGVCCNKLWYPYLLRKCGHSFCEDCLLSWFRRSQPAPTCPDCRTSVREMPTENNMVKDLVQNVSNAQSKLGVRVEPCPARTPRSRSKIEAMFRQGRPDPGPQHREQQRQVTEAINPAPGPAYVPPHHRLIDSTRRRVEERRREGNDAAPALPRLVEQPERDAERRRQQNPDREQRQEQVVQQQQRQRPHQDRRAQVLGGMNVLPGQPSLVREERQSRAPEQEPGIAPDTVKDVEKRIRHFDRREARRAERHLGERRDLLLQYEQLEEREGIMGRRVNRNAEFEVSDQLETLDRREQDRREHASRLRLQLLREKRELEERERQRQRGHQQRPTRDHPFQQQSAEVQNHAAGSRRAPTRQRVAQPLQAENPFTQALLESARTHPNRNRELDLEPQLELSRQFWEDVEGRNA